MAAAAGALFGAAASATAIFLSKKENRQKVAREIKKAEKTGEKAVKQLKSIEKKAVKKITKKRR